MVDDPDLPLLKRFAEGDRAAAAELMRRRLPSVHAVAWRMLGRRAEAEEVAQETFARAWRQSATWRPGQAKFATWLHQVAANLCRDRLRRRRDAPLEAAGDPADDRQSAADTVLDRQRAERVRQAIAQLPERQARALELVHFDGLSGQDAAAVLSVSVEALESLLARGRRALKARLVGERDALLGRVE